MKDKRITNKVVFISIIIFITLIYVFLIKGMIDVFNSDCDFLEKCDSRLCKVNYKIFNYPEMCGENFSLKWFFGFMFLILWFSYLNYIFLKYYIDKLKGGKFE